ncbi:MAG: glutamine amidotransferase [Alcanivoracaceae bacterium]|nr:glutamine amidotransferase [Alcanivoracaceae bacterium]
MTKIIAIIQTGQPVKSALQKYGDFDAWFIKAMDIDRKKTKTFRVYDELVFPEIEDIAGLIITGSPAMLTQELDWSEITIHWLKRFLDLEIPVLGVCYGHQQLAKLLGGTVDWNPNGRQMGQVDMHLKPEAQQDDLFASTLKQSQQLQPQNNTLKFLATHQQSVINLPDHITILGTTELDPYHCFRYKNHIWGLQFHPEFTADICIDYIQARTADLVKEGLNPTQMIKNIENLENGKPLLQRFKELCFHFN